MSDRENLKRCLEKLDVENDNHWTKAGLPRLETLKLLTGISGLTSEMVTTEFPLFNRMTRNFDQLFQMPFQTPIAEPVIAEPVIAEPIVLEPVIADEIEDIDGLIAAQERVVSEHSVLHAEAQKSLNEQEDILHSLLKLKMQEEKPTDNQAAIISYLESQQQGLVEKTARIKLINDSGIDLKELAANLKSPLDAALARKRA